MTTWHIFQSRDTQKRYSNGGTLQSILTEATSCGSSKNSLTSMQLQSSQNQQNTLKLVSPASSSDDKSPRSYDSENRGTLTNSATQPYDAELKAVKEEENDNGMNFPGVEKNIALIC